MMHKFFSFGLFLIGTFFGFSSHASIAPTNLMVSNEQHLSHRHTHRLLKARPITPVDINHADDQALSTLKGIGPKKASAIIAYRNAHGPFQTVEDLTHVKGIGKKSLDRLETSNPGRIVLKSQSMTP